MVRFFSSQVLRSPKISLSTLFRRLRSRSDQEYQGDIPLLASCIYFLNESGRIFSRSSITYAVNYTEEKASSKKQKNELIDWLYSLQTMYLGD